MTGNQLDALKLQLSACLPTTTKLSSLKSTNISYFNDLFINLWTRKFPSLACPQGNKKTLFAPFAPLCLPCLPRCALWNSLVTAERIPLG
jgi:hypothetical protein